MTSVQARGARPRGSKDKRYRAVRIKETGRQLPLDYMLQVLNDASQPIERRDRMAIAAAPYVHPRLTSLTTPMATFEMTSEQLEELLRRELEYYRRQGNLEEVRQIEGCLRGDGSSRPRLTVANRKPNGSP
jgi:hypothetical protein